MTTETSKDELTFAQARKRLTGPLHFGDPDQIAALHVVDTVDELRALQAEAGLNHCEECDGEGIVNCDKCKGTGECSHCGGECGECDGTGEVDCEDCHGLGVTDYDDMTERRARELIERLRVKLDVAA